MTKSSVLGTGVCRVAVSTRRCRFKTGVWVKLKPPGIGPQVVGHSFTRVSFGGYSILDNHSHRESKQDTSPVPRTCRRTSGRGAPWRRALRRSTDAGAAPMPTA